MNMPMWFVILNILTSCFGMIYFFAIAQGVTKQDGIMSRWLIKISFTSCGITLFLSWCELYGIEKYTGMFLFFSWFSVFLSAPFLRKPRILRSSAPEKVEDLALIEKPHPHDPKRLSMARGRHDHL